MTNFNQDIHYAKCIIGCREYLFKYQGERVQLYIDDELCHEFHSQFAYPQFSIDHEGHLYFWFWSRVLKIHQQEIILDYKENYSINSVLSFGDTVVLVATELGFIWRDANSWQALYEYCHSDVILTHKLINRDLVEFVDFDGDRFSIDRNRQKCTKLKCCTY